MAVPLLLPPFTDWYCPNCTFTERTRSIGPDAARMHTCPGLHMLTAPLIPANVYAKVVAEERADYLGREIQETGDDGKPYMAVHTIRDDRADVMVNPGVAMGRFSS